MRTLNRIPRSVFEQHCHGSAARIRIAIRPVSATRHLPPEKGIGAPPSWFWSRGDDSLRSDRVALPHVALPSQRVGAAPPVLKCR